MGCPVAAAPVFRVCILNSKPWPAVGGLVNDRSSVWAKVAQQQDVLSQQLTAAGSSSSSKSSRMAVAAGTRPTDDQRAAS